MFRDSDTNEILKGSFIMGHSLFSGHHYKWTFNEWENVIFTDESHFEVFNGKNPSFVFVAFHTKLMRCLTLNHVFKMETIY